MCWIDGVMEVNETVCGDSIFATKALNSKLESSLHFKSNKPIQDGGDADAPLWPNRD